MDTEKIESLIYQLLEALGEDPNREGLQETPKRVAQMMEEVYEGIQYTNAEIAEMYGKTFAVDTNQMVVVKDITCFSHCEHHMALMYDMKATVAYIPKGRVIGLSKIARICDAVGKRLQLQERIGRDIADIMAKATGSDDVAVILTASHACVTTRGIKNRSTQTKTVELRGRFKTDATLQVYLQ